MFIRLKGLGKFRKSKAYGLVGCLTLSAVLGLAAPELPVIGGHSGWQRYKRCGSS